MCGITGIIDFKSQSNQNILEKMTATLEHRGPDDIGIEMMQHNGAAVGLGFRRLSIIDLTLAGHQPMTSTDENLTIVFNGEIYNHAEIRKTLEEKGCRFKSHSDTEVILQAYSIYGLKCIALFTGMFSIAIYDRKKEEVVLIRDRAGIKPFYYYWENEVFLFASELKCFHQHPQFKKELNTAALSLYFQHGYIPAPHCIFKHSYKLLPGHYLVLDLKKRSIATTCYWDVTEFYNKPKLSISFEDAVAETEKILSKACNYRMIADVPVGIFLSGGYDSSLVTALIQKERTQKLKTFTIGFEEEKFNEAPYARQVAEHLGTEHHEYTCTYKEAMDIIPLLPAMYDEPFADSSAIPTYLVCKMARQQVTVALSADGGDETFAGYTKYQKALRYLHLHTKVKPILANSKIKNYFAITGSYDLSQPDRLEKFRMVLHRLHDVELFNIITQSMTKKEVAQLVKFNPEFPATAFEQFEGLHAHEALDKFLWTDYKTFLVDDILQKVDRASMAVSLEAREPLLDHHIIEWAAQLPADYKLKAGKSKLVLREITHKYLPKELMEREKMGFQVPIENWMRNEQKPLLMHYLNSKEILKSGVLNANSVNATLHSYLAKKKGVDGHRLWKILMFQMWQEKWMS